MRAKITIPRVFVMFICVVLLGCVSPTSMPTLLVETPTPSVTTAPSLTFTPQPTSTYPPLPTPEPTLHPEKALAMFEALQDENCKLPCYLGITPGQTTLQTAQAILERLGSSPVSEYEYEDRAKSVRHRYTLDMGDQAAGERIISHSISLIANNEIVQIVEVHAGTMVPKSSQTALATYRNYWQRYSASQIFLQLGKPDHLYARPILRSGEYGEHLTIIYDDQNIEIVLYGTGQENNLCPPNEARFLSLNMVLSYPEATLSIYDISDSVPLAEQFSPIEDVIDIGTDEFYDSVMANPSVCFEITQDSSSP